MFQRYKNQQWNLVTVGWVLMVINTANTVRGQGSSLARSPEYRDGGGGEIFAPRSSPLNSHEPSCEELRAMWRFSKRQSRAAEITNEIPTYRDPFAYNVWDPYYPTTRSIGGIRINQRYRDVSRPVFGRILHKEPRLRELPTTRNNFNDITRLYGAENKGFEAALGGGGVAAAMQPRRRVMQFRFSGQSVGGANNALTPQKGSFQRLKELVWTERARELAQQRKAEETAARAAVLKEISNGHGFGPRRQNVQQLQPLPIVREGGYNMDVLPPSSSKSVIDERTLSADEPTVKSHNVRYTDNSWLTPSSSEMLRRPLMRERNHSKLRHGFPVQHAFFGGGTARDRSSYAPPPPPSDAVDDFLDDMDDRDDIMN